METARVAQSSANYAAHKRDRCSRRRIFASAGLDVERKVLGSADIIRSALTSGDIANIVGLPTDAVVRARLAGLDWRFLGIADNATMCGGCSDRRAGG